VKRSLEEKTLEVDFFRSALQRIEARHQDNNVSGESASTKKSGMPLQGSLSVERMCQLALLSRAGYYRYLQRHAPVEEDMILQSAIQQIVLGQSGKAISPVFASDAPILERNRSLNQQIINKTPKRTESFRAARG